MKIVVTYETQDYKVTIPLQKIIDLFELTDDQVNAIKQLALESINTS